MSYIPDLTERFPEGFGGVDMTPSFYGEPVDYSRAYGYEDEERWGYEDRNYGRMGGYEPSYEELVADGEYEDVPFPRTEPLTRAFEIGTEYQIYGIYGGITYYKVEKIDRENKRILLSETWVDVDGTGKRPAEWHDLEEDDNGNEKALEWESEEYGKFWIHA